MATSNESQATEPLSVLLASLARTFASEEFLRHMFDMPIDCMRVAGEACDVALSVLSLSEQLTPDQRLELVAKLEALQHRTTVGQETIAYVRASMTNLTTLAAGVSASLAAQTTGHREVMH
jgi:hypothetical protein